MNKNKYAYIHKLAVGDKLFNIDNLKLYIVKSMFIDRWGDPIIVMENSSTGEKREFPQTAIKETMVNITDVLNAGLDLSNKDSVFLSSETRKNIVDHLKDKNRINSIYTKPEFDVLMLVRNFLESQHKTMMLKHCCDLETSVKGNNEHTSTKKFKRI